MQRKFKGEGVRRWFILYIRLLRKGHYQTDLFSIHKKKKCLCGAKYKLRSFVTKCEWRKGEKENIYQYFGNFVQYKHSAQCLLLFISNFLNLDRPKLVQLSEQGQGSRSLLSERIVLMECFIVCLFSGQHKLVGKGLL